MYQNIHLSHLPFDFSLIASEHVIPLHALHRSGLLYEEKLKRNAISTWNLSNLPSSFLYYFFIEAFAFFVGPSDC